MSNQKPVTIYDPIHDSVRAALESRWLTINQYHAILLNLHEQIIRIFHYQKVCHFYGHMES